MKHYSTSILVYKFEKIIRCAIFSDLIPKVLCAVRRVLKVTLDFDTNQITWPDIQKKDSSDLSMSDEVTLEFAFYSTQMSY